MNVTLRQPALRERGCMNCQAPIAAGLHFCPVCGVPVPAVERMRIVRYEAIQVNPSGKAYMCPNCDNEELVDGDFCMICGANMVNRCSDSPSNRRPTLEDEGKYGVLRGCGAVLPGNARYCPKCGNESTFFQCGWLRDWKNENPKKAIRNTRVAELYELREDKA